MKMAITVLRLQDMHIIQITHSTLDNIFLNTRHYFLCGLNGFCKSLNSRPVQDTFENYLDTDTFSKKYLFRYGYYFFKILSQKSIQISTGKNIIAQFVDEEDTFEYLFEIRNDKEEIKDENYECGISDNDEHSKE